MGLNFTPEEIADTLKDNPHLKIHSDSIHKLNKKSLGARVNSVSGQHQRTNKYGVAPKNERTYNGVTYHSKKEMEEAKRLTLLWKTGQIKGFISQIGFLLPGGAKHRLDFAIINLDNTVTWREIKGRDLPLGKLKRRQVEELYHIHIEVIS